MNSGCVFFFSSSAASQTRQKNLSNYFSEFLSLSTSSALNLYYPLRPVSKSQSAIVVWITSDKTSPFVCLAVGSVQVMFALSHSLPIECTLTHTHIGTTGNLTLTGAVDFMLITSYRFSFVRPGEVTFAFLNCEAEHLKEDQPSMGMPGPL